MEQQGFKRSETDEIFSLVTNKNGKIIIVAGNYQVVDEEFDTFEEAELYISSKPYKLIFNTFQIIQDYAKKAKQNTKKTEKNA